jgi:hypothetical protein
MYLCLTKEKEKMKKTQMPLGFFTVIAFATLLSPEKAEASETRFRLSETTLTIHRPQLASPLSSPSLQHSLPMPLKSPVFEAPLHPPTTPAWGIPSIYYWAFVGPLSMALALPALIANWVSIYNKNPYTRIATGIFGIILSTIATIPNIICLSLEFIPHSKQMLTITLYVVSLASCLAILTFCIWNFIQGRTLEAERQKKQKELLPDRFPPITDLRILPTFAVGQQGDLQGGFALSGRF